MNGPVGLLCMLCAYMSPSQLIYCHVYFLYSSHCISFMYSSCPYKVCSTSTSPLLHSPLDDVPGPSWWTPPTPVARRHSRQWKEERSRPAKQDRGTQSVSCPANCHTSHCHSLSLFTTLHHPVHHCVLSHTILVWSTHYLHGLFHLL